MDMLCCTYDLLATVGAMTESKFVPRMTVRTAMFTHLLSLFLDPPREAADPGFEFHVLIASNQLVGNVRPRGDVMLVLVSVSMFFMTLLSEPTADLAIHLSEPMADGTMVPEGLLQLPVSVNFLFIKPRTGFS